MGVLDPVPRSRIKVPEPYQPKCKCAEKENIHVLQSKLADFKAENLLLGRTLKESQCVRQQLEQQLLQCKRELDSQKAQLDKVQSELEQVKGSSEAQTQQLHLAEKHTTELEELVLELNEKLQAAVRSKASPSRQQSGQQRGQQRGQQSAHEPRPSSTVSTHTEQPLCPQARAGSGTHASDILQHHLTRLEELYQSKVKLMHQEHEAALTTRDEQHSKNLAQVQVHVRSILGEMKQQAQAEVERVEAGLTRQTLDQTRILEQLDKRCLLLEAWLRDACSKQSDTSLMAGQKEELGRLKQQMELLRAQAMKQERPDPVKEAAAAHLQAGEATARREQEVSRQHAALALGRLTKVQADLVQSLADYRAVVSSNTSLSEKQAYLTEQLAAAEGALQVLRDEVSHLRSRLLEAQTATLGELLQMAVDDLRRPASVPDAEVVHLHKGHGPVATYVRVLEHAVCECEAREASMKHALCEAQYLEQQARGLLTSARSEQVACQRALLQQIRRVQTLEALRLKDAEELLELQKTVTFTIFSGGP